MQKVKICLCQNTSLEVCESPGSLAPTLLASPTPQNNLILHKILRNKFNPADIKREMSKKFFYGSLSFNLSPPKDPGSVVSTPVCVIWTSLKYHWLTLVTVLFWLQKQTLYLCSPCLQPSTAHQTNPTRGTKRVLNSANNTKRNERSRWRNDVLTVTETCFNGWRGVTANQPKPTEFCKCSPLRFLQKPPS